MKIDGFGEILCPICGSKDIEKMMKPGKSGVYDTIFRCNSMNHEGLCFCKGCKKLYPYSGFGKHGDVWECKECGRVQWEHTEQQKALLAAYQRAMRSLDGVDDFINQQIKRL